MNNNANPPQKQKQQQTITKSIIKTKTIIEKIIINIQPI